MKRKNKKRKTQRTYYFVFVVGYPVLAKDLNSFTYNCKEAFVKACDYIGKYDNATIMAEKNGKVIWVRGTSAILEFLTINNVISDNLLMELTL